MTFEEATQVAVEFRSKNPYAIDVRVERCEKGGYRAVFSHHLRIGRKGTMKREQITKQLVASWGATLSVNLWTALPNREQIDKKLSRDDAIAIRQELEPQLPKRWRFPVHWFEDGTACVIREGKQTLVTGHCDESKSYR